MKTVDQWFQEYGVSHQNPTNKLIHWICIPLIMFSLLGLVWDVGVPVIGPYLPYGNVSILIVLFALLFYMRLSVSLTIGMLVVTYIMLLGLSYLDSATEIPTWQVSLAIFVLAWIGQFIGHKIEGKKPSFFQDLQFLLIGPLWLMGFVYKRLSLRY